MDWFLRRLTNRAIGYLIVMSVGLIYGYVTDGIEWLSVYSTRTSYASASYPKENPKAPVSPTRIPAPTSAPTAPSTDGFTAYRNGAIRIKYPSSWVLQVDKGEVSFLGDQEMMFIFWSDIDYDPSILLGDSLMVRSIVSDTLKAVEQMLYDSIEKPGNQLVDFNPIAKDTIGRFQLIGHATYTASTTHPDVPTGHTQLIVFPGVICGKQRMCMFIFERFGLERINQNDWELVEKLISSLEFLEDRPQPGLIRLAPTSTP